MPRWSLRGTSRHLRNASALGRTVPFSANISVGSLASSYRLSPNFRLVHDAAGDGDSVYSDVARARLDGHSSHPHGRQSRSWRPLRCADPSGVVNLLQQKFSLLMSDKIVCGVIPSSRRRLEVLKLHRVARFRMRRCRRDPAH